MGRGCWIGLVVVVAAGVAPGLWAEEPVPTAGEIVKMREAMPDRPRVEPEEPRKLLIFSRSWGYKHSARPYGAEAFAIMGRHTGAYEPVVTDDDAMFEPENLEQFDAVVLNNTNNEIFLPEDFADLSPAEQEKARRRDAMLKESFVSYLRDGGGLAVVHAGVASFRQWPEFEQIVGARFDNHPWNAGSTVVLRVEEPDHPVMAAFKEPYFIVTDEIYQVKDPYSREHLRVLLTIDMDRTTTTAKQKELIHREDGDFAMTWVKSYGKGRVFYCAIGHQHELFWNPIVLQHYLDGFQFVLGDLEADTTPSEKLAKK